MTNPHGTPIWYELLSADADASSDFYAKVLGWTVHDADAGGMDYRMIDTGGGDFAGGLMQLTSEMQAGGAKPAWLFYIGVDDVDAAVEQVTTLGGAVQMPAITMEGVGRMAMVTDPHGIPFYVMRGASPEASRAFDYKGVGKCSWNELATPDQAAAHAFYGAVFGWTFPDKMPMGPAGDYVFVQAADQTIGAIMPASMGPAPGWQFYFRATDIDAAAEAVRANGGTVHDGPMEVPGGDWALNASDPAGVRFGVVAAARGEG
ncbi:hypothetical protein SAMN06297144_1291 [Sphingomonas guangdongensis]|uniref:VOC domain-containing protein n=1 Tax=Sphingomonas guangdongensis TaxID=1141890 RepID=A0A285QFZ4_9SPHN|nr:VOC family protein [Sphingomonas guangdongensis]SOB80895.1 hypothetical protein SAMN06297144_1291 [Sphingomonas guangdongensis]